MSTRTEQTAGSIAEPKPTAAYSHDDFSTTERLAAEYVLPLRWSEFRTGDVFELTDYLIFLAEHIDVTVVDGSPEPVFSGETSCATCRPPARPRATARSLG
ncbi:hypothetical protein [Mycetocola manganoxydans]|uniref:hypothetical protein n=1 Tax=Mycetocola manganoxydans TaxID=699879 RepID=UPI001E48CB76|nr:hypothetical protein [Mycetocola manganoxydans]